MKRLMLVIVVLVIVGIACSVGGESAEVECPPDKKCDPEIVEVTRIVTKIIESKVTVEVIVDAKYLLWELIRIWYSPQKNKC